LNYLDSLKQHNLDPIALLSLFSPLNPKKGTFRPPNLSWSEYLIKDNLQIESYIFSKPIFDTAPGTIRLLAIIDS